MKKFVLLNIALFLGLSVFTQVPAKFIPMSTHFSGRYISEPLKKDAPITQVPDFRQVFSKTVEGRDLTFIPIGASGNAYGYYGNPRTYLWADPLINSVVFTHRMIVEEGTYGSSRIAYDVSTQGGSNGTWQNNVHVYEPLGPGGQYPDAAGRYPQGAIFNPAGNTDPDNAYYTYFIPTIDNSNGAGIWGGYAYGVNQLTAFLPPSPTQHNVTSEGDYWRVIPNAITITPDGHAWMVDGSFTESGGAYTYTGQMIVNHGVWDPDEADYVYEEYLMEVLGAADGINDTKIAFAPDGQTGYICVMSDSPSDPQDFNGYHPILYKTTDGGENWDGPIHILLGGYDGIEAIKYYWDDETIMSIDVYAGGFDREEVYYNMGFNVDMVVDENGPDIIATVPFVYMEMDPADPTVEVNYWYIDGWTYSFAKPVGKKEMEKPLLKVSQNYPNPFNDYTRLQVSLTIASEVSFEVHNLMGQKVYQVNYGQMDPGSHILTIDGSCLPGGVYFFTLTAGKDKVTGKMTVQ